jgi:hypothetical protein
MRAEEIADQCLYESGARGFARGREVALVGLALVPDGEIDRRAYRKRIKEAYLQTYADERGSIFLIFVLPLLISLISNWIVKWIWSRTNRQEIRSQATAALCESQPKWTGTLTSIDSPQAKHTGQPK